MNPSKLFSVKKRNRGQMTGNGERKVSSGSSRSRKGRSKVREIHSGTDGEIIEKVDEEDCSSYESSPDEEEREVQRMIKLKKNFLCKNLVE